MGKLFGTDGIRGVVGEYLTESLAIKIGESASYVLGKDKELTILIGRDTRESGEMLSNALTKGLMNMGANVIDLGIVPTPAVSYLIKKYNANGGAMISASHNPSEYNGIKLFNSEGYKLPDEVEDEIEEYILEKVLPNLDKEGTYLKCETAINDYVDFLVSTSNNINKDLKVVVDTAYGSASITAPILFNKLGLNATIINSEYNGVNINDNAGSTHLEGLINKVRELNANVGIAYDGDADRCLMIDNEGNEVNGDKLMAISALYLKGKNKLTNNTLVGTVMSNLGLIKFCHENNINYYSTKVGDRYVLESMLKNNFIIGGEQSGHIIFKNYMNTGDGELTSIQILNIMSETNKNLKELSLVMKEYPQVLINVKVKSGTKNKYESDEEVIEVINKVEERLGSNGRILVRASGTEDKVRVMIEGLDKASINDMASEVANVIESKFGV